MKKECFKLKIAMPIQPLPPVTESKTKLLETFELFTLPESFYLVLEHESFACSVSGYAHVKDISFDSLEIVSRSGFLEFMAIDKTYL